MILLDLSTSFRGDAIASNPESRDSGAGPSDHPGMTGALLSLILSEDVNIGTARSDWSGCGWRIAGTLALCSIAAPGARRALLV